MPRTLPLHYALPTLLLVLSIAALLAGGFWIWVAIAATAILAGPADEAVGDSRTLLGPPARIFVTANLYATLPLVIVLTVVVQQYYTAADRVGLKAWLNTHGIAFTAAHTLIPGAPVVGATIIAAIFYSLSAVTVAHELVHWTNDKLAVAVGRALFGFTLSPAFFIAHVYGHHRNVGTLKDHATARRGERLLPYAWRASFDENAWAFNFEVARLKRKGHSVWSWRNRLLRGYLYPIAIVAAVVWLAGLPGLLGFVVAAIGGKLIHRSIDYTQHYGLVRVEGAPIQPRHSWECHRTLSNAIFFNLPRHADHHMFASRRTWELKALDNAPMLPHGYKTMVVIAWIPALFRRVMNPRLAEWDRTMASEAERALVRERGWEISLTQAPASTRAAAPS
jgi:alkane 1-monooxygenase